MLDVAVIGLSLGSIYALVALGFTLIYATTGVINFAQGSFVMLSGIACAWVSTNWGWPLLPAVLVGLGVSVLAGVILAVGMVLPLWRRGASEFTTILGTLMFLVLTENVVLNTAGSAPMSVPAITPGLQVSFGGGIIQAQFFWVVGSVIVLVLALGHFLTRWRLGMAMRACSCDQANSRLLGISPYRIAIVAIALSALIGGIGGVLVAPLQFTSYGVASAYSIKGFLAAVVGGLGNIKGSLVGGLLVGLFEAVIGTYVSSYYLNVFVMGLLVLVLLVRPKGIFSSAIGDR